MTGDTSSPTVLVTGATGFLGKYVVQELTAHGYTVIAAGRNRTKLAAFKKQGIQTFCGNLTELSRTTLPVDFIIHSAALSTVWGSKEEFFHHNVLGTQQMVDFARRNGVRRLVHLSSPSIYSQRGDRYKISEDDVDPTNELTNYIWSKLRSEELLARVPATELETVILRPRGLMGAEDPSIVPRFLQANAKIGIPLVNGGKHLIDLTSVENVALACRLALESPQAAGRTYNITNGEPRPLKDLIEQMFSLMDEKPRYRPVNEAVIFRIAQTIEKIFRTLNLRAEPPLIRYTVCTLAYGQTLDITHAREELGYEPRVSLDQGIKACADAHRI